MAAAAATRLMKSLSSPRTPTGTFSMRRFSTTRPPTDQAPTNKPDSDPKKALDLAKKLVAVLEQPVTEGSQRKAQSLVNELNKYFPAASATEGEVKGVHARLAEQDKVHEMRFAKTELHTQYLQGFTFGTYFLFSGVLMTVPAGFEPVRLC